MTDQANNPQPHSARPNSRYYIVTGPITPRLVLAKSPAQAMGHVVRGIYTAKAAGATAAIELMNSGVVPEDATAE